MRILIDECLDWRLSRELPGHDAFSVSKMGWTGIKNGKLLDLAIADGFELFITSDKAIEFQQHIVEKKIAVVILDAAGTQLHQTAPLMAKLIPLLSILKPGKAVTISA